MRKIGELKGKPIVEGNPNEVKNNQIHYKESEGNINLSERKNGELKSVAGATDDYLSYRYFKNIEISFEEQMLSTVDLIFPLFNILKELEGRPCTLSLPFLVKIKEFIHSSIFEKKYQIKFIDIMYDQDYLNTNEVLGVMIPKYLNVTLISSAPGFGNVYPEYNMPIFDCLKELAENDTYIEMINMVEKLLTTAEITREEFLNMGN